MILSGTVSGVIGAAHLAKSCGIDKCLSLDIGGTSADIAVISNGQPKFGTGELIGDFNIYIPSISVSSVGEGGGSIAWVDDLGVLKVGPESAGSRPGPAGYGRGGDRPTITDAMVATGFLGHAPLGFSAVDVDIEASRRAIATLSDRLGDSVEQTAEAILQIAVSGIYTEVSALISKYGIDIDEFSMLAFGGAGPMLGCYLSHELGVKETVVPLVPGVLSALGGLIADLKSDFLSTVYLDLTADDAALIVSEYTRLKRETEDFSCQLMTPEGLTFASPITTGATWYTGLDYGPVTRMIGDYRPGDVFAVNDPYSGFVATHTPDVHLWMPVFRDGRLVCFVGNHVHNTDMGGAVPASLSRTLTEVQQEGIRVPPVRIMRDGVLDERLMQILDLNVRSPTQNRGELDAQLACLATGERKVQEIIDRFGIDDFVEGSQQLLTYAEQQARQIIASIPDGAYVFSEFADEDSMNGVPCRINITMTVRGDDLDLDFTGSDPQVVSSLNMPTGGNPRHSLITVGLIYCLHTLRPDALLNAGTARILTGTLPLGTIVNPVAPAAVGMRSLISAVTQACFFGLFSQAVPDKMPACPAGGSSLLNVRAVASDGRRIIASIGPVGGGAGGGPAFDGQEGCGANSAFLKNTPVEINEAEVPVDIIRYGLVPDTGGAGRWRGGNAAVMKFRMRTPEAMVTARNRNRATLAAWGVRGGKAGANSRFTRNPGTAGAEELAPFRETPVVQGRRNAGRSLSPQSLGALCAELQARFSDLPAVDILQVEK